MSFLPSQITIPKQNSREIPIGMRHSTPVGLSRDKDGVLCVEIPIMSISRVKKEDESPEAIIRIIDQLFSFVERMHPELLKPDKR